MGTDLARQLVARTGDLDATIERVRAGLFDPAAARTDGLVVLGPAGWQVLDGPGGTLGLRLDVRTGRDPRQAVMSRPWRLTAVEVPARVECGTVVTPDLRASVQHLATCLLERVLTDDGQALLAELAAALEADELANRLAAHHDASRALVRQYATARAAELRRDGQVAVAGTFEVLAEAWTGGIAELEDTAATLARTER